MENLLQETIQMLHAHNVTTDDVEWVGSKDFGWFTWEDFENVANVNYDAGFGAQQVASDIIVAGEDFYLERHEYDGSERWEFKRVPLKPDVYRKPVRITANGIGWENLNEIHTKD